MVGTTVYDTRKSPIVTLYEPSVGLFNHFIRHLHTCNPINTQLLSRHAKLKTEPCSFAALLYIYIYIYGVFPPFVLHMSDVARSDD